MSGTTIGQVNINLRMSLAQFKNDVKDGTSEASRATKQMASEMSATTSEARGTLSLLGEEIGVTIPRHLQTMIAKLPGVGTALSAAFNAVAVLALIEVIVKIAEKIGEFQKKAEEAANAIKKAGDIGRDALRKIDEEVLALDEQIATLKEQYLTALIDKLKEIDNQSLDQIVSEFEKLEKAADEAIDKQKLDFFQSIFDLGKSNPHIDRIKQDLERIVDSVREFQQHGDQKELGRFLADNLARVNKELQESKGESEAVVKVLEIERDRLQEMGREYDRINEKTAKQKEIAHLTFDKEQSARIEAETKAREELTNKVRELMAATEALTSGERTADDLKIQKIEEQIAKWRELDAERQRQFPGIKTMYAEEEKALQKQLDLLRKKQAAEQAMLQRGVIPGAEFKLPDISAGLDKKPIFGGTSGALELAKIKANGPEAQAALTKVLDSVESVNKKFEEQVAILDELHAKYPDVFNEKMLKKAKEQIDPMRQQWKQLGASMADTIEQAALFGRSWSDALKSMLAQLLQVIIQMTILKKLQQESDGESGGGGGGLGFGGIFSSIVGGLFGGHRASGGGVNPNLAYMVGENGPEMFVPSAAGSIVPNHALKSAEPHVSYQFVQHITTPDADSFKKSHGQLAAEAYGRMQSAHTRNR